ncbi:MAG: amidohydrolase [Opitutales bacterium TMED158]|nr:MAG: amidohydrolase [Opitutales bacterium TMED158]
MKVDSHQHFWRYDPVEYPWIGPDLDILKRDFLPLDLEPILQSENFDGCLAVQARQTHAETEWLLELADRYSFVKGVVGWLPLQDPQFESILDSYRNRPRLVGLRHVIQAEADDAFILRDDFNRGIAQLENTGLVYDILIFERHLGATLEFVDRHPNQRFVVDHIAKPVIRRDAFAAQWRRNLIELGRREHVSCKLSGVVTEVRDETWDDALLAPYFETALEAFGSERLLFGSDWPVCLLRADYSQCVRSVENALQSLSRDEQSAIWGDNAERVYGLR